MAVIPVLDKATATKLQDPLNPNRRIAFISVTYFDTGEPVVFVPEGVAAAEHALPKTGAGNIYLQEMSAAVLETTVISQDKAQQPTQLMAGRWIGSGGSYRCLSASVPA